MIGKLRHLLGVLSGIILTALAAILVLVPAPAIPQSDVKGCRPTLQ